MAAYKLQVFSTQRFCVLFAVVFIRCSLFYFVVFCSHLQNIIFLQSLKNQGHVFHKVLFYKENSINYCIAVSNLNNLTIYLLCFYQIESANYKTKMFHPI